ncbi:MAG: exosortase family protein XrtF, partial [Flammeovirgaceae bacterium]
NTLYGFWIEWYRPSADPMTVQVAKVVAKGISWIDEDVKAIQMANSQNVAIRNEEGIVIEVFEGCNSINVMLVFVSFIIAFRGTLLKTIQFAAMGCAVIYLLNLLRVAALYAVELNWPRYLYLFHKYLFTGGIYLAVFFLWYLWSKQVKANARQ